ncbi:hypothetical protein [Celeribacter sp.]|uniref:hypothetical protein n=1 Tax=Celeribacter sp. TaxID=1890673 RepID=UPI003A940EBD
MTALTEYDRLEASALWRAAGESQRREVVVSIGDATLTISNLADQPLSHWSLPAIERINGTNERTAIYAPASDTDERLEVEDETFIAAIERIQHALERGRARPGRLRNVIFGGIAVTCAALAIFWLPDALIRQATTIVPNVTRVEIGEQLLDRMQRLSGMPCSSPRGNAALARLNTRLRPDTDGRLVVVESGVPVTQHLPGGIILLNRAVVEDYDDPAVTAGFVLDEMDRAATEDPLVRLLQGSGLIATLRLLTTGKIDAETLDAHTEILLTQTPPETPPSATLIERFVAAEVAMSPYAYALDVTGQTTLPLIEADAVLGEKRTVLSDGDWLALQGICGN